MMKELVGGLKIVNGRMYSAFNKYVALRKYDVFKPDFPVGIKGQALLMYIAYPFFMDPKDPALDSHINIRNSLLIVRVLNNLGYSVDIIDYTDSGFETNRQYDLVIGVGSSFDYSKEYLKRAKTKVYYATGLHFLTETNLIYQRHENLWRRRGIRITPTRINTPYYSPEKSDCIISIQNSFTNESYSHLNKPIYPCTLSGTKPDHPIAPKTENTRTIMWLSGPGMVLKGLDLVLEAAAGLEKTCTLIICADMSEDLEFKNEYHRELTEYDNIINAGFVNAGSERFRKLAERCIATIYPYPEGEMSGSLMTCMQHGMIPILSRFSTHRIAGAGIHINDVDVAGIRGAMKHTCNLPPETIEEFSKKALECVSIQNSPEKEYDDWENAIKLITNRYNNRITG